MHRIDDLRVAARGKRGQPVTNPIKAVAETLAAMAGDHNELSCRIEEGVAAGDRGGEIGLALQPARDIEQRVDAAIAGDDHPAALIVFARQILRRRRRGGEHQIGDGVDGHPVELFRPWPLQVEGTQPGLDMADGNLRVERRHRRSHRCGGVAVHQHQIGLALHQQPAEPIKHPRRDVAQGLVGGHDVEIVVEALAEDRENLIEHLAMLAGGADDGRAYRHDSSSSRAESAARRQDRHCGNGRRCLFGTSALRSTAWSLYKPGPGICRHAFESCLAGTVHSSTSSCYG